MERADWSLVGCQRAVEDKTGELQCSADHDRLPGWSLHRVSDAHTGSMSTVELKASSCQNMACQVSRVMSAAALWKAVQRLNVTWWIIVKVLACLMRRLTTVLISVQESIEKTASKWEGLSGPTVYWNRTATRTSFKVWLLLWPWVIIRGWARAYPVRQTSWAMQCWQLWIQATSMASKPANPNHVLRP